MSSKVSIEKEILELNKQKESLYDFLERKIYTTDVFIERSKVLAERIASAESSIKTTLDMIESEKKKIDTRINAIPQIENVLRTYYTLETPDEKNYLLKLVIKQIVYIKSKNQRNDDFEISLDTRF
jgi:hypothetical protein